MRAEWQRQTASVPDVSERDERYAKREALHGGDTTTGRPRRRGRPVKYSDTSDVEGSDSQILLNAGDRRKRRRTDGGAPSVLGDGWAVAEKSKWKSHREWSPPRATSYRRGERGTGAGGAQNGAREKRAPPAGFMALSDVDWSSDGSGGAALDSNGQRRPPQRRSVLEPHAAQQQQPQQPRSMHEARSSASSENTDLVDTNGVGKPPAAAVAVVKQQVQEQPQGPPGIEVPAAMKQDPDQANAPAAALEPVVGV